MPRPSPLTHVAKVAPGRGIQYLPEYVPVSARTLVPHSLPGQGPVTEAGGGGEGRGGGKLGKVG